MKVNKTYYYSVYYLGELIVKEGFKSFEDAKNSLKNFIGYSLSDNNLYDFYNKTIKETNIESNIYYWSYINYH